jgi:beta-lactamase superfamily II metal-dependent hydrolase
MLWVVGLAAALAGGCGGLDYDEDSGDGPGGVADDDGAADDDSLDDDATFDPQDFAVQFYDVGLGDAILLEIPGPYAILVDGGPYGAGADILCPDLTARGVDRLDVMIATHPDYDHISGLVEVFDCVEVDEVWVDGETTQEDAYLRFAAALEEWGGPVTVKQAGDVDSVGEATLGMVHADVGAEEMDDNSLVFGLTYGDFRLLLTGDVRDDVQQQLADALGANLACDVLKIPAHGLAPFSSDFVALTAPPVAVLSVGPNDLGYPSQSTLDAYAAAGATIYRTDEHGGIRATYADGQVSVAVGGP